MIKCPDCDGRGRWASRGETATDLEIVWQFCNTCEGKGFIYEEEDLDDYDIGGEGEDD